MLLAHGVLVNLEVGAAERVYLCSHKGQEDKIVSIEGDASSAKFQQRARFSFCMCLNYCRRSQIILACSPEKSGDQIKKDIGAWV